MESEQLSIVSSSLSDTVPYNVFSMTAAKRQTSRGLFAGSGDLRFFSENPYSPPSPFQITIA